MLNILLILVLKSKSQAQSIIMLSPIFFFYCLAPLFSKRHEWMDTKKWKEIGEQEGYSCA